MARVKQFADDLGISKNQAQTLINKGRSRKDGGSQILESVMKPKKYGSGGSNKVTKLKKGDNSKATMGNFKNLVSAAVAGKISPKEAEEAIRKLALSTPKVSKKLGGATDFGMLSVKAGIDKNPKATQADRIAGATKKARGGTTDMKKSPKRAESRRIPKASPSKRSQPKETLVPFKGVLKTSEGEKLRNVDGKTFVVKPPKSNMQKAKKMRGGGMAIQGLGFKGVR